MAHATDDKSLGGDDADGRSVSTLDIADIAAHSEKHGESHSPASNPGGVLDDQLPEKNQRRESVTSLQVEDVYQEESWWQRLRNFQCDMKFCTIAFIVVSLIFVVIVVPLSFALPKL